MSEPTRIELLELDVDVRLSDLWREMHGFEDFDLEVTAAFVRAAYAKGYYDALTEDRQGSLALDHGYSIPKKAA